MKREQLLNRLLAAALGLAFLGLAAQPALLAALTRSTLLPLRIAAGQSTAFLEWALASPHQMQSEIDDLRQENAVLRRRLALEDAQAAQTVAEENQAGLTPQLNGLSLTPVWVAGQDAAAPDGRFWVAPAGDAYPGCAVVDEQGHLAGKIESLAGDSALVLPLTAEDFSAACWVGESRECGILQGNGKDCLLSALPRECRAQPGDLIVTNGLGGVLPAGLIVGQVTDVFPEDTAGGCAAQVECFRSARPTLLYLAREDQP